MAEKSEGLISASLKSAVRMNDAPRSVKERPFSCFQNLTEGWRTAKPGAEHVVDPMINLKS